MQIADKRILVTGAGGGIGTALCRLLAREGAALVLNCRHEGELEGLRSLPGTGHTTVTADIGTVEGRSAVIAASRGNGGIDAVVNLAGILEFGLFEQQDTALIEKTIGINLTAPMLLCRELIPLLKECPEAAIVNVGSTFGSIGHPGFVAYCASKAGLRGFTEALSRELADTSIRVSYIAPRATVTSLNSSRVNALNEALGNASDHPGKVAREIIKLLRSGGRARYLGWPEKLFVRINALLPGLVHKALVKNLGLIKHHADASVPPPVDRQDDILTNR